MFSSNLTKTTITISISVPKCTVYTLDSTPWESHVFLNRFLPELECRLSSDWTILSWHPPLVYPRPLVTMCGYCDVILPDSRHLPDPDVERLHSLPDTRHRLNLHTQQPGRLWRLICQPWPGQDKVANIGTMINITVSQVGLKLNFPTANYLFLEWSNTSVSSLLGPVTGDQFGIYRVQWRVISVADIKIGHKA